jgi:hypothetical protein
MQIVPQSVHEAIRESEIIRRYQAQRADELRHLYGFDRVFRRIRIYFWARRRAMSEILEVSRKTRHEKIDPRIL